eukprot:scaffold192987_cov37-Prasinocladus_malaysianus.AAC.1
MTLGMPTLSHSGCSPSTISIHSRLASEASFLFSLWPSSLFTALDSESLASASLRHLDRMSPTAGPLSTLTISAVLPPSSDTGRTWVTFLVSDWKAEATLLKAVPPLKTTTLRGTHSSVWALSEMKHGLRSCSSHRPEVRL